MPSLAAVAAETVAVVDAGRYLSPGGRTVELAPLIEAARAGTCLFTSAELQRLTAEAGPVPDVSGEPRIEVSAETTAQACRRLVEADGEAPAALNFASAKNPGGGFLGNAKAQEEDLARASALYACLVTQMEYYEANRREASLLYTDHIIYSPGVPFFRDDRLVFLESPFCASIVTAPAPNAGEVLKRDPKAQPSIRAALERRAHQVLRVAAIKGHRCLVLGAWGCGVFRNDPAEVADVFARALAHAAFQGVFHRVVFAIYDRTADRRTLRAFEDRFRSQA
jgi:uncharacterized protein (TIGR02452 family)